MATSMASPGTVQMIGSALSLMLCMASTKRSIEQGVDSNSSLARLP